MGTYREVHGLDRKAGLKHIFEGGVAEPYQVVQNGGTYYENDKIPKSEQADIILRTFGYDPDSKDESHGDNSIADLEPQFFVNGSSPARPGQITDLQDTCEGVFACLAHGMYSSGGGDPSAGYTGVAFDISDDLPKALIPKSGGRFRYVGFLKWTDDSGAGSWDAVGVALFVQSSRTPSIMVQRAEEPVPGREGNVAGEGYAWVVYAKPDSGGAGTTFKSSHGKIYVYNFSTEPVLAGGDGYGVASYVHDSWVIVADECDDGEEESDPDTEPEPLIGRSSVGGGRLAPIEKTEYGEIKKGIDAYELNPEPEFIRKALEGSARRKANSFFKDNTKRSGNLFAEKKLKKTFTVGRRITLSVPRTKEGSKTSFAPYTFRSKGLPSGLSINHSTGSVSGSVTSSADFNFSITVVDSQGNTDSCAVEIKMREIGLRLIAPANANQLENGVEYSGTIELIGGVNCYLTTSTLPDGLELGGGGEVSGTPTTNGTVNVTVTAVCNYGDTAYPSSTVFTDAVTFVTATALEVVDPTDLSLEVGVAYTSGNTVSQTGGVSPYTYSSTTLPAGLTLNTSTGAITGTPSSAESIGVTFTVTDSAGRTATSEVTYDVTAALEITGPSSTSLSVGVAYSDTLSATGGTTPYTYSIDTLPAGLTLNTSTGAITGTPLGSGTTNCTATVTDDNSDTDDVSFTYVAFA